MNWKNNDLYQRMIAKISADVSEKGHYLLTAQKLTAVCKHLKAGEDEIIHAVLSDCSSWHESNEDGSVCFHYKKPKPNTIRNQLILFQGSLKTCQQKANKRGLSDSDKRAYSQAISKYKSVIAVLEKLIQNGKYNDFVTEHDLGLVRFMR